MTKSVLIITTGRSGYAYLSGLLRKNAPEFYVLSQIFKNPADNKKLVSKLLSCSEEELVARLSDDPVSVWKNLEKAVSPRRLVARINYYDIKNSDFWSEISDSTNFVHLIRKNIFETYVSNEMTRLSGKWTTRDIEVANRIGNIRLSINRTDAINFIFKRKKEIDTVRDTLIKFHNYSEIYFEEIKRSEKICLQIFSLATMSKNEIFKNENIISETCRLRFKSNADQILNYFDVADLDASTF